MSKIIVESKPCSNYGYTMITIKGPDSDGLADIILAAVAQYEIERKGKTEYYLPYERKRIIEI